MFPVTLALAGLAALDPAVWASPVNSVLLIILAVISMWHRHEARKEREETDRRLRRLIFHVSDDEDHDDAREDAP